MKEVIFMTKELIDKILGEIGLEEIKKEKAEHDQE